jgi:hypothetical protein
MIRLCLSPLCGPMETDSNAKQFMKSLPQSPNEILIEYGSSWIVGRRGMSQEHQTGEMSPERRQKE